MNIAHYDLVIVGGGMVGASLAAALCDTPLSIALIEGNEPADPDDGQIDLRVSAISRASQRLLERIGAWDQLAPYACAYHRMHVWDAGGSGSTDFSAAEIGEPNLGHIIENRRIQHALWQYLQGQKNLTLYCPARLSQLSQTSDAVSLELEDDTLLSGSLIIGADGARSRIRELSGIAVSGWGYGQTTIVGNVRTTRAHQHTAWQRFLPSGPVAFLPLYDGRCSIAWHTRSTEAEHLMALDDDAFCEAYTRATGQALGRIESVGPRGCFPLRRQHATNYFRGRIALIGDAAHTVHPLAGQGVNLGFLDADVLARLLHSAATAERDIATKELLSEYERQRRPHNALVMRSMDLFSVLYALENPLIRWLRSQGMELADRSGPLKATAIRYAMGFGVPALPRTLPSLLQAVGTKR